MSITNMLKRFFGMSCLWMATTLSRLRQMVPQQSNTLLSPIASDMPSPLFCYTTVPGIVNAPDNGFDSDSYIILIDNCCSACVTSEMADFEGVPTEVHVTIKEIGGAIELTHKAKTPGTTLLAAKGLGRLPMMIKWSSTGAAILIIAL